MFNHALLYWFVAIPCANCILKGSKEYFVYGDVEINEGSDCHPLNEQQYYWQTINNENITQIIKLNCLYKEHSEEKYFPKCCPPNHVYDTRHHKCVQNNMTGIHDVFSEENVLIRTDLFHCPVVLDYILAKDLVQFAIKSDRSLDFNGKSYKLGSYCLDNHLIEEEFVIRTCENVDVCINSDIRCIKKCCPDGQYYKGLQCQPGHHFGLSLENNTRFVDRNEYFHGIMKSEKCNRYMATEKHEFNIMENGTIVIREFGIWKQYDLEENYYCMEYIHLGSFQRHQMLLCMLSAPVTSKIGLQGAFMIASCICLLFTLFGYFTLPDLKNLIGNIIITYCSCFTVAFIALTWVRFNPNIGILCDTFAFAVAFAFMSAFAWMTILSFEIWRVLGSMVTENGHRSSGGTKRYLQYSLFGWLVPVIVIGISFIDYMYEIYPAPLHITLGNKCVLENKRIIKGSEYGYVFQFVIPCGILLLANSITFAKTIIYIFKVKSEIRKMNILESNVKQKKWRTLVADKEKLAMVLKIFLLMGLNWLFELLSSIIDFTKYETLHTIEIIFDAFNALQGVFIFCIFMLKKKIFKSLLKILNIKLKNRRSSVATCSTEVVMIPTSVRARKYER